MRLIVNGVERTSEARRLAELVAEVRGDPSGRGVAVALNGEVVPRSSWPETMVSDGDRIEVLAATQGG